MQTTDSYLAQLNIRKAVRGRMRRALLILSLLVTLGVFWGLKLTGITMAGEAFCGMQEHVHSESCDLRELVCQTEEAEGHTHSPDCQSRMLVCPLAEQPGHVHTEECVEDVLICGQEETAPHTHGEDCFTSEESSHICGLEETEGHTHTEECVESVLICGQEETDPHSHGEGCFAFADGDYICGMEETEGHTHGDDCYRILEACPLEAHIHIESCYSDLSADLENADIWEMSLADVELTDDLAENIVKIAGSQLGYPESTRNFQVDEHGIRRGITRYGQWYGNPYGDWSVMFAGFCLYYAGAEDLPISAGPETMRIEWEEAGLYVPAEGFLPAVSNLLFLDKDENGAADAVAIITGIEEDCIVVIEGNLEDTVARTDYPMGGAVILGYGRVPVEPQLQFLPAEGAVLIAQTQADSQSLLVDGSHLIVYMEDDAGCYAIDGYGEIVDIVIDEAGRVYTEVETPELLIWGVAVSEDTEDYAIQNLVTQMYLPQMGISTYALEDDVTPPAYQYARAVDYAVWLDGTCGGLMSYGDALNQRYTVTGGTTFQLPETWQSPSEYSYILQGWYDVVNNKYYAPGAEVTVNGNMVFYPDWVAATYDIGQFNSQVADTVSTNEFVTVRMFDYNALFNVLSSSASVSFSTNSHTETWKLITSGNSPYSGEPTLNYIFRDWDPNGDITYPSGVSNSSPHYPTSAGSVYSGLYNDRIGTLLFNPDTEVIGKLYLGTADHLFQYCDDPSDSLCGYYYYDSERNAASYNRSEQRFYVYDYLERTTVSATTDGVDKYSDFLPLNSPYANTGGKAPATYTYNGLNNEYRGVTHYMFDATNSSSSNVATNFFYGMSAEVDFYLPNAPGSGGNKDVYGKDMHFKFSGDDDVWIFVDGKLVLDLGGIHGMEGGDINFSTGEVTINGVRNNALSNTLQSIGAGEHTLTLYYLERGSSMSNCAILFNLAPRFSFSIQKEDVLTKDILNGAQFSVYTDAACTQPADLWTSKASHDRGDPATHIFTVTDGVADMWGMGSGNTYYIKETKPPDAADYSYASGIICLTIDKQGQASYSVELVADGDAGISGGFTVHGFRIDEQTQRAYIVATNAPAWVEETTAVTARKVWNDGQSHTGESVTVYLTVTDPDGTVRRLQEGTLSSANNWQYTWENLPKYRQDGITPVQYGVEEAYVSGYYSKVTQTDTFTITTTVWSPVTSLENGKTYIFKSGSGFLSTLNSNADTGFKWVTEDAAQSSPLALWTVSTSGSKVKLTNGVGQSLCFYYGNGSSTDFFAATGLSENNNVKQFYNYSTSGSGIRLYYTANRTSYYLTGNMNSSSKFVYDPNANNAMVLTPMTKTETITTEKVAGWGYEITNTPLDKETSLTVSKHWDYGLVTPTQEHERFQVTVALLANGKETGRTVTLSLKNGWSNVFQGLPYADENGNPIVYTVEERWDSYDWIPYYGEIVTSNGDPPTYSTVITNAYRWGHGAMLPSTGSPARLMYILCGGSIMLASLVYGIGSRRKRERRMK